MSKECGGRGGPCVSARSPNIKLAFRMRRRWGGYGRLAGMEEGNIANVVGTRR
jgi:hypothetical protein